MTKLTDFDQIPENGAIRVYADNKAIAIFRIDGEVHAIDAVCPHMGGPLEHGYLKECVVMCPLHGWDFDVRTGKSPSFGMEIDHYDVEVRDGEVYLKEG